MRHRSAWNGLCILASLALAGLLMAQDRKSQLTFEELRALLGKDHMSDELYQFREKMKVHPEVWYSKTKVLGGSFYHSWKDKGLSLCFNEKSKLDCIHLYAANYEGFQEYKGTLPAKLQFEHNRRLVEKTLGKPDETGGGGVINYWVYYKKYNLAITYNSKDEKDLDARIALVTLLLPDEKEN